MGLVDALITRIDRLIRERLDVAISSRLASTDTRLNNLNNLDATISSRAAANDARFTYLDATISSRLASSDSRLNNLDATVSSRATPAQVNAEVHNGLNTAIPATPTQDSLYERIKTLDDAYTATRAGYLDRLDTTISSRLASSDTRLNNLDATISSRLASSDTRLNTLKAQRIRSVQTTVATSLTTVLNITGSGYLICIGYKPTEELRRLYITVDGGNEETIVDGTIYNFASGLMPFRSRFNSSLLIKAQGNAAAINMTIIYSIDI